MTSSNESEINIDHLPLIEVEYLPAPPRNQWEEQLREYAKKEGKCKSWDSSVIVPSEPDIQWHD